jgi:hypothetical protein
MQPYFFSEVAALFWQAPNTQEESRDPKRQGQDNLAFLNSSNKIHRAKNAASGLVQNK